MAPELLDGREYNLKADVYTYSLVLWEMLNGQAPYAFIRNRAKLIYYVVDEGGRPEIDDTWPSPIQDMLESSFDGEAGNRPKMHHFMDQIRKTLISLRGSADGLSDTQINHRRTLMSFGQSNKQLVTSFRNLAKEIPPGD